LKPGAALLVLLAAAGCRTRPYEIIPDLAPAHDLAHDALPDLTDVGVVLYGVNDHGETPLPDCRLRGDQVGDYAFIGVPTGMGNVTRVDLFAADPGGGTYGLGLYAGGEGAQPGRLLATGSFTPGAAPGWVGARLDQPVPIGGVLWVGSTGPKKWTFVCPWAQGGFGVTTRVGAPGAWQVAPDEPWMFRLVED
jgi:hypothetical protein